MILASVLALTACRPTEGLPLSDEVFSAIELTLSANMATVVSVDWLAEVEADVRVLSWEEGGEVLTSPWSGLTTTNSMTILGHHQLAEVSVQLETAEGHLSEVQTITTGFVDASLPGLTVVSSGDLEPGYLVVPLLAEEGGGLGSPGVAILDREGYVWAQPKPEVLLLSSASLSPDRTAMWAMGGATMQGWSRDGVVLEEFLVDEAHHDFLFLPDGTIAAVSTRTFSDTAFTDGIIERAPDGTTTTVFDLSEHLDDLGIDTNTGNTGSPDLTHANSLAYDADRDAYLLNLATLPMVLSVDRATGDIQWVIHGAGEVGLSFSPPSPYTITHQITVIDGGYLQFVNLTEDSECSRVVEIAVDAANGTAEEVAEYGLESCITVFGLGGVQRLDNGNTLIIWSTGGLIEEYDPSGAVVWSVEADFGSGFGYGRWMESIDVVP
ncbi:MAG: hypothetical protein ACI8RZ_000509 [Myxococcota bacterium]|jgi:hypothetical protein